MIQIVSETSAVFAWYDREIANMNKKKLFLKLELKPNEEDLPNT